MTQKSITIVSVTGHSGYTLGSQYAIERSYLELRNHIAHLECLLISPDKPDNLPSYIRHIRCEPFSYVEYNLFMLYALHQFIHTDFALTVQDDGWILDGNLWRDEFLDYDYIGAPIPCYIYAEHTGSHTILGRDYWSEHFSPIPPHCIEPQNGGVSLRSKRILTAPRDYHITASLSMAGASETEPIKLLNPEHGANNEDIILSGYHRPMLERSQRFSFCTTRHCPTICYGRHLILQHIQPKNQQTNSPRTNHGKPLFRLRSFNQQPLYRIAKIQFPRQQKC